MSKPLLPVFYSHLTADAQTPDRVLFTGIELYAADWLDTTFKAQFNARSWPHEKVLRFQGNRWDAAGCDEVLIESSASQRVAFLQVYSRDLLLIVDLEPGDRLTIPVTPFRPGQTGFSSVHGALANGQKLARVSEIGPDVLQGSHYRYAIKITNTGLGVNVRRIPPAAGVGECHPPKPA